MCEEEARTVLKVPEVKGCCFCFNLTTGVRIIAYVHIFPIVGLFLMAFCWHMYENYDDHLEQKQYLPGGKYEDGYHLRTYYAGFFMEDFTIFNIIGTVVFAIFLLHGTYKQDSVYFEPWLILKITSVSMAVFNLAVLSVLRVSGHKPVQIFWELIHFALDGYLLIVVHSLYKQYKNNN